MLQLPTFISLFRGRRTRRGRQIAQRAREHQLSTLDSRAIGGVFTCGAQAKRVSKRPAPRPAHRTGPHQPKGGVRGSAAPFSLVRRVHPRARDRPRRTRGAAARQSGSASARPGSWSRSRPRASCPARTSRRRANTPPGNKGEPNAHATQAANKKTPDRRGPERKEQNWKIKKRVNDTITVGLNRHYNIFI